MFDNEHIPLWRAIAVALGSVLKFTPATACYRKYQNAIHTAEHQHRQIEESLIT